MEDLTNKKLQKALKLIRTYHLTTVNDLASQAQMSAGYISEIETGKKPPTLEVIRQYSAIFNIKVSSIFKFAEDLFLSDDSPPNKQINVRIFINSIN